MSRRSFAKVTGFIADGLMALVRCAALILAPWRVGGLLQTVSIPRLREHPLRTSLTVVGIALGVAILIAVALVNQSILGSVASTIDTIAGRADLQVGAGSSGFDIALFDKVRETPGVAKATLVLEQTVGLRPGGGASERLLLLGVDLLNGDDEYFRTYDSGDLDAVKADPFVFLNSPYNIILGRSIAQRFGYKLHDEVLLQTPSGTQRFDIWGILEDKGVGRAFGGAVALMDYRAMQIAFDRGNGIDRVDVALEPGTDVAAVENALRATVGPAFSVDRPAKRSQLVATMLSSLRSGLTMASLVALLVGMFLVHNTMSISIVQRRREIGILRALGATRRDVLTLFTLEGFLLGVVGAAFGAALGIALALLLLGGTTRSVTEMFLPVAAAHLHVDRPLVLGCCSVGVVATSLAAAFAALQAARSNPIETLRAGALLRAAPPPLRPGKAELLAGVFLVAAALLLRLPAAGGFPLWPSLACVMLVFAAALLAPRLVGLVHFATTALLGRTGSVGARMANENLPRDIVRASTTAAALMVGVAMATSFAAFVGSFVGSMSDWVDQTLSADLWVTSGARVAGGGATLPISHDLNDPLAAMHDVERVERVRMADIAYKNFPIKLISSDFAALDGREHLIMLEGTQEGAVRKMHEGAVLVTENFSRRFGVHLGNRIALAAASGTRTFEVCGVVIDYTSDMGAVLLDSATYVDGWGDERVDTYKLYMRDGADPELTRRIINERFGDRYDLFVLTNHEFKQDVIAMLDQAFSEMHVLEAIAIVIAIMGIVNALLANVLDRVREVAVLRAVGMLRRQVRQMVIVEGFLLGVAGVLGGVALGVAIGHVLLDSINVAQTGWYLPYRPSWTVVVEIAALVVVSAALAGWYPARHAARLDIADGLGHE